MQRILLALLLFAAGAAPAVSWAGPKDNSLAWASDSMPANLLPYGNDVREGVVLGYFVWDAPTYRDPATGEYKPHLADKVTLIDPLTIELHMRDGVTAHDGQVIDARDVVETVKATLDPAAHIVDFSRVSWLSGAELVDNRTVRLTMKQPFGPWQEYLTTLLILPREALAKLGLDGLARAPIGTGPYKITQVSPGSSVVLERFDKYFGGAKGQPSIDRITFRRIPDAETQIAELMAGNLDFIWRLTQDQAEELKADPDLKVEAGGTIRIGYVSMDAAGRTGGDDPFTKLGVRRAVAHAIDRQALAQNLAGEGAEVVDTPCHPKQFGCDAKQAVHYDYDPAKARALLAEAGYPDGFDVSLTAYRDRPWTEAIIGDLRKVGIRCRLNWVQADTSTSQTRAGKTRMIYAAWGSTSIYDVAASTSHFFTGTADDQARDEAVIGLLNKGDHSSDPAQRRAAYGEAIHRITEQAYWLPILAYPQIVAFNKALDFKPSDDEVPRFYNAKWTH